ncbi:rhodanese-like domain-containing protein [Geoglobus ahangari]|nr:rhodanese-like domain-containing protein [Geoglobus ahangari]
MKRMVALLLIITSILVAGCIQNAGNKNEENRYKDITVDEAYRMIEEHAGNSSFVIIDVRTPKEYEEGHIPGAINIDVFGRNFRKKLEELDLNKTYLVYCKTGFKSKIACETMVRMGFRHVYNMEGGIEAWMKKGYPVVRQPSSS